jgi:hypothetical protein
MGVRYTHSEKDFIDFNNQRLLPHKLSQYGPSLSVGDVDGNGLDDIFIGGTEKNCGRFLMQQANGRFTEKRLFQDSSLQTTEDMGALLKIWIYIQPVEVMKKRLILLITRTDCIVTMGKAILYMIRLHCHKISPVNPV